MSIQEEKPQNVQQLVKDFKEPSEIPLECRYCLLNDTIDNLCSPCKCTGYLKYVHQDCMKDWIISKSNSSVENLNKITFNCEICKYEIKIALKYTKSFIYATKEFFLKLMNLKNFSYGLFHSIILGLLYKRLKMLIFDIISILKQDVGMFSKIKIISHNTFLLLTILSIIGDIAYIYNRSFEKLRGKKIKILNFEK